jgi:hypothetical protein
MDESKAGDTQAQEVYRMLSELTDTMLSQDARIKTLEKALMALVDNVALNRKVLESHQDVLRSRGLIG